MHLHRDSARKHYSEEDVKLVADVAPLLAPRVRPTCVPQGRDGEPILLREPRRRGRQADGGAEKPVYTRPVQPSPWTP